MTVATAVRSDVEIQNEVLAELRWEPRVQSNEIGVAVKEGVVTLTGYVDSYTRRWAAEEASHRVRGVKAAAPSACEASRRDPCPAEALPRAPCRRISAGSGRPSRRRAAARARP